MNIQIKMDDNDAKVLLPAIAGSEETSVQRHMVVLADQAFSSIGNFKAFKEKSVDAAVPARRMKVEERDDPAKSAYKRLKIY